jgi:hypothetical protein
MPGLPERKRSKNLAENAARGPVSPPKRLVGPADVTVESRERCRLQGFTPRKDPLSCQRRISPPTGA